MNRADRVRISPWIETVSFGLLAALLYRSNLFLLLFGVPVQILFERCGQKRFYNGSAICIAAIGITRITLIARTNVAMSLFIGAAFDLVLPVTVLMGMILLNRSVPWLQRRFYRLLMATALTGLIIAPIIVAIAGDETLVNLIRQQLNVSVAFLGDDTQASISELSNLVETVMEIVLASFLLGYVVILTAGWYIGSTIGQITVGKKPTWQILWRFHVPERMVWPLLIALSLLLIGMRVELGALRYLLWNAALVMLFVYGVQGLGVVWYLLGKYTNERPTVRLWFMVLIVGSLFLPIFNAVVVIGMVGLGLSEVWVNWGRFADHQQTDRQ